MFGSRFCRSCAVIAMVQFAFAGAAGAYSLIGTKWPQPGGLNSPITLTYSYQNMFDGGLRGPGAVPGSDGMYEPNGPPLSNTLIRDSIEEALGVWSEVVPIHFVEVFDNGLAYGASNATYGQIRFRHVDINGNDPAPPALPVAKAQAYYPSTGVLGGDVEFDHGDPWQEIGTQPIPDILGATIHELGHSLGLGHSNFDEAAMYWIFNRFSGIGTGQIYPDDIAGIHAVYGTGVGSVTPLVGTWPDRPRLPNSSDGSRFIFSSVPSGQWYDPVVVSGLRFVADPGTLFSQIVEFPAGFAPLTLTVDGNVQGTFVGGQSFSFASFAGGGVSEFQITGVDPLDNTIELLGLPLKLAFTTPMGSFVTTAIPEPATILLLFTAMLAIGSARRRHR
jgi:matrixin